MISDVDSLATYKIFLNPHTSARRDCTQGNQQSVPTLKQLYRPENTELLKEFIEYANNTRSVAGAISTYKKWMDKKAVNRMIWMLSNIETNYVTATTEVVKLFDYGYIPTPLELYEERCDV